MSSGHIQNYAERNFHLCAGMEWIDLNKTMLEQKERVRILDARRNCNQFADISRDVTASRDYNARLAYGISVRTLNMLGNTFACFGVRF